MTRYRIGDVIRFTGHRIDARDPEPGAVGVCAPIAGARGSNSPHPDPFGSMVYAIWNDGSETSVWVRATEKLGKVKIPKLESFKGTHGQQMSAWVSAIREAAKLAARKFASWTAPAHSAPSAGHEPADIGDAACPQCGGEGTPLGGLGNLMHYRCRQCGWDFSRKATKGNPRHDVSEGGYYKKVSKSEFEEAGQKYGATVGFQSVHLGNGLERLWSEFAIGGGKRQGIGFIVTDFKKVSDGKPTKTYWLADRFRSRSGVQSNPGWKLVEKMPTSSIWHAGTSPDGQVITVHGGGGSRTVRKVGEKNSYTVMCGGKSYICDGREEAERAVAAAKRGTAPHPYNRGEGVCGACGAAGAEHTGGNVWTCKACLDEGCDGSHPAPACGYDCPKFCAGRGGGGKDCGCSICDPDVKGNPKARKFRPGDKVRFTGEYLRNTGQPTGPEGLATWKVIGTGMIGSIEVAHLEAGYGRNTEKRTVNVENLEIDYRQNPSCRTCGGRVDGDGWDGECGNCADRSESSGKRPRTPRSRCRTCRGRVDGDGWNGECGNCADRSETARQNPLTPGTRPWQRRHGFGGTSPGAKALKAAVQRGDELISYVVLTAPEKGDWKLTWHVGTGNTKTDLVIGEAVPPKPADEYMAGHGADKAVELVMQAMKPQKYTDGTSGDGHLYGIVVWHGKPKFYLMMKNPETYRDHLVSPVAGRIPYTATRSGHPHIVEKLVPINRGRMAPRWIK